MSPNILRFILVFLLALPNLSSMAETQAKQANPALAKPASSAKPYLEAGIKKFSPCYMSDSGLSAECAKACGQRCKAELKDQLKDTVDQECSKICSGHCSKMISQAGSQNCDLNGAYKDFAKALTLEPNNQSALINIAYVKIAQAKKEFTNSNKISALKLLSEANSDAGKAREISSTSKDANGISMADSLIETIKANKQFVDLHK